MPLPDVLIVALFFALVLAAGMHALSASGHFPRPTASLGGGGSSLLLFGSMALVAAALIAGTAVAGMSVSWPALVLGGGAAILLAPLALQRFSDGFVDGRGALAWLAAAAVAAAASIALTASLLARASAPAQAISQVNTPIKMRMTTQTPMRTNSHSRALPIVSLFISAPCAGWRRHAATIAQSKANA